MIDRLLCNGFMPLSDVEPESVEEWRTFSQDRTSFAHELVTAPVFVLDNVADYALNRSQKYDWDLGSDFPNVAPPYPTFWMEYRTPRSIMTQRGLVTLQHPTKTMGFYLMAERLNESSDWSVGCMTFTENVRGIWGPNFLYEWSVAGNGEVTSFPRVSRPYFREDGRNVPPPPHTASILVPVFLSLSFLHCKNVTTKVTEPDPKLNRAREKEHKPPFVRYHELQIEPMRRVLETEGHASAVGLRRALHICRGHFADYTQGKGLFGRHHGRYWIDSQVRGSAKSGVMLKDYNVTTPRGKT